MTQNKCISCKYLSCYMDGETETQCGEMVFTSLEDVRECGRGYRLKFKAGGRNCAAFKESEANE